MKRCSDCGSAFPATSEFFYANRGMPDGLLKQCKDCTKARHKSAADADPGYRARKAARARAYYLKDPQRWIANAQKWHDENPERVREISRKWKARAIEAGANRAYLIVHRAIKAGVLVRASHCEVCGRGGKIEASHHDYSLPLEVAWLCRSCHIRRDRANPRLPKPPTV